MIYKLAAYFFDVLDLDLIGACVVVSIIGFKIVCSDRALLRNLPLIYLQRARFSRWSSSLLS